MTDQDQAARLAAIRAKRGQAPAAMPVTRQQPVQAGHEMWAAPLESAARPAPVAAMVAADTHRWLARSASTPQREPAS